MTLESAYKSHHSGALPDGVYPCRLTVIKPISTDTYAQPGVQEPKLLFLFEALERTHADGRPALFFHRVRPIYGPEGAALTKLLDTMLGRRLTLPEFEAMDLRSLVGRRFHVLVARGQREGRTFNTVLSATPIRPRG